MPNVTDGPRVAVVDYGMGNLYNVGRALRHVGLDATITSSPEEVVAADGVVLPGVGAMSEAMRELDERGLSDALRAVAASGVPLFGICLGMQLLMEQGSEHYPHAGLGLIAGGVERVEGVDEMGRGLRVPHIGWNAIEPAAVDWADTPLEAVAPGTQMYFVHSFRVVPSDASVWTAECRYGDFRFCAALALDNVFGCQFHPERSGPQGLRMLRSFAGQITQQV